MRNIFKTKVIGGYDKASVLQYVDMMNVRILKLENFKKEGGDAFTLTPLKYPEEVLKEAKVGGFDKEDVDKYVAEVTAKIKALEKELGIRG